MERFDEYGDCEKINRKKVFCLGVWDMFHIGHLILIQRASSFGKLTVGVVCDEAVKKQKGEGRPIIPQEERASIVFGLKGVNDIIFTDDFLIPNHILADWDIIIIGADQHHIKNLDKISKDKIVNLPRTEGVSTTELTKKLKGINGH